MSRSTGSTRIPKYRLHSPSGLAVARFNGVDFYLGKHGSQESRDESQFKVAVTLRVTHCDSPPRRIASHHSESDGY